MFAESKAGEVVGHPAKPNLLGRRVGGAGTRRKGLWGGGVGGDPLSYDQDSKKYKKPGVREVWAPTYKESLGFQRPGSSSDS